MTFIEFFDKSPIENIISAFAIRPDKIVYVGESKMMKKSVPFYEKFLKSKGISIPMEICPVNKNNLWDVVNKLSAVVEAEDECAFDLTGGEDLLLVAVGIVFQTYRETKKLHMHRFNMRNGTLIDCDNDGEVPFTVSHQLSVEDWVALHGGVVAHRATEGKNVIAMHKEDICRIWDVCKSKPGKWNYQIGILNEFQKYDADTSDPLHVCIKLSYVSAYIKNMRDKLDVLDDLVNALRDTGLVTDVRWTREEISFVYRNAFVKNCVGKAGEILETKILQLAYDMRDKNKPYCSDADRGVFIDWDGVLHESEEKVHDTENEIDVMLMHDLTPVFISCKNGAFDDEELYKLFTVSSRFGGAYAKRILVCSDFSERGEKYPHLAQRARDMGITIIPGVQDLSDEEIKAKLKDAIS
ncbi:MAG: DUF1887 family protein [Clostridia bacterium]|nr:DUF1887 family protein [Clostridia bacterium]